MENGIVETKSFDFAVRIVKLYHYLTEEKMNSFCQNKFCEVAQV